MSVATVGDSRTEMRVDSVDEVNVEKCRKWLETCSTSDGDSVSSYGASTSNLESTDDGDSSILDDISVDLDGRIVGDVVRINNEAASAVVIAGTHPITHQAGNVYQNVCVNKSRKVHLGNVTYINGPVYVQQRYDNLKQIENAVEETKQTCASGSQPQKSSIVRMMDRKNWLAQPPLAERTKMEKPAKIVIICHSATEGASSHPENVLLVRLIQQFHIESRNWDDIGYNFLVGCDGNTYEGRGWGVQGAHTQRYNRISVGICIVGCFIKSVPPQVALRQAIALIDLGVEKGFIDPEYSLVGHSQCIATESPGRMLFEVIKTWPRFDASISLDTPTPLLE